MTSFEFVDELPISTNGRAERLQELRKFADALCANPGKWAKYPGRLSGNGPSCRASEIRHGKSASFRGGQFDAAVIDGVLYVQAKESH